MLPSMKSPGLSNMAVQSTWHIKGLPVARPTNDISIEFNETL